MDEVLTPDSSRYWPVDGYAAALRARQNPPSYDKQFVRDRLEQAKVGGKPGQDGPGATPAAGRDREDSRRVLRSWSGSRVEHLACESIARWMAC